MTNKKYKHMKYKSLTSKQLNEMHQEFATFLATQKIDAKMWQDIKKTKPEMVEEEINIFSDLVWEKVLSRVNYLDFVTSNQLDLFRCNSETILRVVIKCDKPNFSFLDKKDYKWFIDNSTNKFFSYFKGEKPYTKERNVEIFEFLEKGCFISNGKLFETIISNINKIINN